VAVSALILRRIKVFELFKRNIRNYKYSTMDRIGAGHGLDGLGGGVG
jgi:hypothetical protein